MQIKFKKLTKFFKYNKKTIFTRIPKKHFLKMERDNEFFKS